ncbi:MAG: hypothetical protein RIR10_82, partial [Planctomycetota bacterium]
MSITHLGKGAQTGAQAAQSVEAVAQLHAAHEVPREKGTARNGWPAEDSTCTNLEASNRFVGTVPDDNLVSASLPKLFIGMIAAMWAGVALGDALPWFASDLGAPGAELHHTLKLCGVVLALGAFISIAYSTRAQTVKSGDTDTTLAGTVTRTLQPAPSAFAQLRAARANRRRYLMKCWPGVTLLLLAGATLGLAIRAQSVAVEHADVELVFPRGDRNSGTLVHVEGTVDEEFSTHGFAVDILSRHFDKEPIHRCVLRDIRFITQNEVASTSHTELGGFVANGAQQQENDQPELAVDPLKQCRLTVSISGVRPSWRVA